MGERMAGGGREERNTDSPKYPTIHPVRVNTPIAPLL